MGLVDDIKSTIAADDVVVYSKSTCPFCRATKETFKQQGIEAKVIEVRWEARASLRVAGVYPCAGWSVFVRPRAPPRESTQLNEIDGGADVQAALLELTGQRTVPNVFVKGQHLGGNDDTQKAAADGRLQEMLK